MKSDLTSSLNPVVGGGLCAEVVLSFVFDVANEIATERVGTLFSQTPTRLALKTDRTAPKSVPLYRPLEIDPGLTLSTGGRPVRAQVRVYDVGVVTVTLRIALPVADAGDLRPLHTVMLDDGRPAVAVAAAVCADVCRELGPAMARPGPPSEPEAYTAFCLTDLGGERDAGRWLAANRRAIAGLLADTDPDRLSEAQVEETLRLQRSFETDDLVVVDWDAALVVDLDGYAEDVLFVLELANLQLEEFRWIDRHLDRYLDRAYADVAGPWAFGTGKTLRSLRRFRVELAKLADEVTHITKFVGDWHLARVYLLARERFHLDRWRESVEHRLGQLDQLYTLLRGDVHDRRILWLEIVMVVFFAADLLMLVVMRR